MCLSVPKRKFDTLLGEKKKTMWQKHVGPFEREEESERQKAESAGSGEVLFGLAL